MELPFSSVLAAQIEEGRNRMLEPLISTDALHAMGGDETLRLIDCRHDLDCIDAGRSSYHEGHLPGAVFLHLDEDLSGALTGQNGRHPLPDPINLIEKLAGLGIGAESPIVVYDAGNGSMAAARAWWMLSEWLGFASVRLLDGGMAKWQQQGGALSAVEPSFRPVDCADLAVRDVTVDTPYLQATLGTPAAPLIVDARSPERYAGIGERRAPVGGHIPGAINRYFAENLGADGLFKSRDQLHREWMAALANRPATEVVAQCGSGVTACHNLLAMKLAGLHGAKLYAGS